MERKTDLRVLKIRNAIKNTFKEMVMEMDASDIQIKELTERAMIHRKTFYLHYTCIEALYEDILSELSEEYYKTIDTIPTDAPFTEVNRVFFEFMASQEPYMEKIVCDPSYREFSDKFFMSMLQHNRARHNPYAAFSKEEQNIINTFLGISSVNLYRHWVQDKKSLPLKHLIDLSGKLFYSGISSVL
jgi:AcrR family transcriptional regulator